MEWAAWEAWAAGEDQQMQQVGAETLCVRSPWLDIEPSGTGAQRVELEVRRNHKELMRHGAGPLERGWMFLEGLRCPRGLLATPGLVWG